MIEINAKLKIPRGAYRVQVKGQLRLPFALRQKRRVRARLVSGEQVCLALPRGEILRGGDLLTASDGRVIEVLAEFEKVLHAECADAAQLAKAAYYFGNRHVPVQVGDGFLRLAADHALEETLKKMGVTVTYVEAPFEPESVAFMGNEHDHGHDHGHDHDHDHGHDHDHDHGHDHDHDHGHGHDHRHGRGGKH